MARRAHLRALLAPCCAIMSLLLVGQSLPLRAAATPVSGGPTLSVTPSSGVAGSTVRVTLSGSGFAPLSHVLITFNAPYADDDGPPAPTVTQLPVVDRPGDNRPTLPRDAHASYPDALQMPAMADARGRLVAAGAGAGAVTLRLPRTAVDGRYGIAAVDATDDRTAATLFDLRPGASQALLVTPLLRSSAPIGGVVTVAARPGTFAAGDRVAYYLEDFAASATMGTPAPSPGATFSGLRAPAGGMLALRIVECPGSGITLDVLSCEAGADGAVTARVQLAALRTQAAPSAPALLSTTYHDQVYAIVARVVRTRQGSRTNGHQVAAGVHIDHGQPRLALDFQYDGSADSPVSLNQLVVEGSGFGAFAGVAVYWAALTNSWLGGTYAPALRGLKGPGFFSTARRLAVWRTDVTGSFMQDITVPNQAFSGSTGGPAASALFAEDFASTGAEPAGARLNEAASAELPLVPEAVPLMVGTHAGTCMGEGCTTTIAPIGSTVAVTGTGFLPAEPVDLVLAGSTSNQAFTPTSDPQPPGTTPCRPEALGTLRADASGAVAGSFRLAGTCNTLPATTTSPAMVHVMVNGGSDGRMESATLRVAPG